MTLQRMIFFVGFFITSATSTIFTASTDKPSAPCALSIEADTGFSPAYASPVHKPRILQEPKKFERPKPGISRRIMNFMGLRRTLWLIDTIKGFVCRKSLTMAEAYYTAHRQLADTIAILNENGLLEIQDNLNQASIETYSFAQLNTDVAVFRPFTSFITSVKNYSQPLRLQAGQLQTLLKDAKEWSKRNPRGKAHIVINAITDLLNEYTELIGQLEHLINFTIKLDGFKAEQQYAARVAIPQGPQLRLMLEGGPAGG